MNWTKFILRRWRLFGRKPKEARPKRSIEKRRSERVKAAVPVFVYGRERGQPFSQYTETANVCMHGGLMTLFVEIERFQTILITNLKTNEDLACRVARLVKKKEGETVVGVEFLRAAPRFWSINFSGADFSPRDSSIGPPR